jgi:hypothetical protein
LKLAWQASPQLIPLGLLVTVPFPVLVTVKAKLLRVKWAVTVFAASIVTTHVPVAAVQAPLQPVKSESAEAFAVRVTWVVKFVYDWVQSFPLGPQLIPVPVTVPVPVPVLVTVSTGRRVKWAVTVFAASIVTTHVPVAAVQAPLQPVKIEVPLAAAVRVTCVPAS